jgi:uncharacterized protein
MSKGSGERGAQHGRAKTTVNEFYLVRAARRMARNRIVRHPSRHPVIRSLLVALLGLGVAKVSGAPQKTEPASASGARAMASYYGLGQPQDFYIARRHAKLGVTRGDAASLVIEALCLGRGRGAEQDVAGALKLLAPLLTKGDPLAHAAAAIIMGQGRAWDSPIPPVVAEEFREELAAYYVYDRAAREEHARLALAGLQPRLKNDAVACLISGQLLWWRVGIPQNFERAEELFRRAWELGCSDAATQLGNLFHEGNPAKKDPAEAVRWLQRAVEAGNAVGRLNLAQFDRTLDPQQREALFTSAAQAGQPDAMTELGAILLARKGPARDVASARQWLEKAAAAGQAEAMARLGWMFCYEPKPGEIPRGVKLLRASAVRNNPLGTYYLGDRLLLHEPKSPLVGFALSLAAAGHGVQDAWFSLAIAYERGLGIPKNFAAAQKCYETAIARGATGAHVRFGLWLRRGLTGPPDHALAYTHFLKAAEEQSSAPAMREVARSLLLGWGVEADKSAALTWLHRAADLGDADSFTLLGSAYRDGNGVPADEQKAADYFQRGAQGGSLDGMCAYAVILQRGRGVPADPISAVAWLQSAAAQGHALACLLLYTAYDEGLGVPADPDEAWKYLVQAAERGSGEACRRVGHKFRTGRAGQPDLEAALHWYQKGADLGHAGAMSDLGYSYQTGAGTAADPARAFALYTRSAEMGDRLGTINLAICYERGIGTEPDAQKAFELRRKVLLMPQQR